MDALTVIMATRNASTFVSDALDSVLSQSTQPEEILVIDADSNDGTQDVVRKFPGVRVVPQAGTGLWQAWNQGIAQVSTPLIAILDSDDRWEAGAIAAHMDALAQIPLATVSIGRTRFFCDSETLPSGVRPELLTGNHRGAVPGATLWRREAFDRLGSFREDLVTASDIEWFLRLRQSNLTVAKPDAVVLAKRIHSNNLSNSFSRMSEYDRDLLNVARDSIRRVREGVNSDST